MRVTVERISNGARADIAKVRSITVDTDKLARDILSELQDKGEAIKSLAKMGGDNRKGTIIIRLPEAIRNEVRRMFDLSREPDEFVVQCRSGKDADNKDVILVSVGFTQGSRIIDTIEDWLIEDPMDGTEARTVSSSRKIDYSLKQLADVLKDRRGRQR